MAYEDRDFTPSTGSMIPSHTETQIKDLIYHIRTFSSGTKYLFNCWPRATAEEHGFCSHVPYYISSIVKENMKVASMVKTKAEGLKSSAVIPQRCFTVIQVCYVECTQIYYIARFPLHITPVNSCSV